MIQLSIQKKLKSYRGEKILQVDASFPAGSVTGISGPSGAGKTTFLKMIAGLISPDAGSIIVGGETWFDDRQRVNRSPQQRKTGFVFQDYALFPNMTVSQHLQYATANDRLINRLLNLGKMEAFTGHKPGHLSGGQQQRLALLRALATEPAILLMDEPFSALDSHLRQMLVEELKIVLEEFNTTCLIVTHHPEELAVLNIRELKIPE